MADTLTEIELRMADISALDEKIAAATRRMALGYDMGEELRPLQESRIALIGVVRDMRMSIAVARTSKERAGLDRQTTDDLQWWKWWRGQQRKPLAKQERDAQIIALWKAGESRAGIARTLGIAADTAKRAIDWYVATADRAEEISKQGRIDRAFKTLASDGSAWERSKAWRDLLEGIDPDDVEANQTALIPLDDVEGCPGVSRFACCSCGALGDSALCRRCVVSDDAERHLTHRSLSAWDQERSRIASFWPEEYAMRFRLDQASGASSDAAWSRREEKERIHRKFIERLTA